MLVFSLLSCANAMNWVTFSSITSDFSKYYNLKKIQVDLFGMLYIIAYPLVNFPESNFIDNKSMKYGVIICLNKINFNLINIQSLISKVVNSWIINPSRKYFESFYQLLNSYGIYRTGFLRSSPALNC